MSKFSTHHVHSQKYNHPDYISIITVGCVGWLIYERYKIHHVLNNVDLENELSQYVVDDDVTNVTRILNIMSSKPYYDENFIMSDLLSSAIMNDSNNVFTSMMTDYNGKLDDNSLTHIHHLIENKHGINSQQTNLLKTYCVRKNINIS